MGEKDFEQLSFNEMPNPEGRCIESGVFKEIRDVLRGLDYRGRRLQ
jgi:hypothetical protein